MVIVQCRPSPSRIIGPRAFSFLPKFLHPYNETTAGRCASYALRFGVCFFLLCAAALTTQAQSGNPYKKKVVSYVDKVLVPGGIALTPEQAEYIKKSIARNINFARFNYSPLPENVTASFGAEAGALSSFSSENITPVLNRRLAPQLLQILDLNKELLSKQNLSEEDRNTFLATKAQAAGLSASQLEAILNSGFFYIPYVDSYNLRVERRHREVKNDNGKVIRRIPLTEYIHALQLGLLWYRLNVDQNNTASVVFIGTAQGWKDEPIVRSGIHEDETFEGQRIEDDGTEDFSAFKSAVDASCFNIQSETKKIEAFKLSGEVVEATLFGVTLNLGSREGVGLDDTYWVEEFEESSSGEIVKNKRGFVKIRQIGDNKRDETATSYAQTITGSNYSQGLSVTELPLLGINGLIAAGTFPAIVSPFDNTATGGFGMSEHDFSVKINSENKSAYGLALSFQTDLANAAKIPEFWAHVGGAIGVTSIDGQIVYPYDNPTDSTDIGQALTGYVNLGLVKKFYFRRVGFLLQADVKYALMHLSVSGSDGNTYKLTNGNLGLDGRAGIEIYVTPVFSVGASAEYNVFGTSSTWSAVVTDSDNKDTKNGSAAGPAVKYSGLGIYCWVNYSIPSLR